MNRCLLLLLAAGCLPGRSLKEERPVIATVQGVPIYLDELRRGMKRTEPEADIGGLPVTGSLEVQQRALLEDLIERQLLVAEAERHNVIVGMDEVEGAYKRNRHGWNDGEFDDLLKEKDLTPAELKRELRSQLLLRRYLRDHVFARLAVTDAEIEAHLESHPELRIVPEQVRALQILVKSSEQAKQVQEELKKGTSFEDLAMKHSTSPEAKSGGDLGFFARGVMPKIVEDTCFGLAPGQVSKVVASDYGHHVFKLIERRPQAELPLEQVRDKVEALLRHDKEAAAQRAKIDELRKAAAIHIQEELLAQVR